jgi:hypothetical protein
MPLRQEWYCWEIMQCAKDDISDCPVKDADGCSCWEMVKDIEACSSNVCEDCLVYLTRQKDSVLTKEEVRSILVQKGVDVLSDIKCCFHKDYKR